MFASTIVMVTQAPGQSDTKFTQAQTTFIEQTIQEVECLYATHCTLCYRAYVNIVCIHRCSYMHTLYLYYIWMMRQDIYWQHMA